MPLESPLVLSSPHIRHGSNAGQPITRRDGVLKVTGKARFAADNHPPGLLYAVLATSRIARGRVKSLNVEAARSHKGVVEVMTPANRPKLAQDPDERSNPFMFRMDALQNDRVRYANQPIALVIAERLEAATEGAVLLEPQYEADTARIGLDAGDSFVPPAVGMGAPAEVRKGDVDAGLEAAATTIDATYETPTQSTTPWSRMPSSRRGTASGCRSTCRARGLSSRAAAPPACWAFRPNRSISAARFSAAASAARASSPGRNYSPFSPRR